MVPSTSLEQCQSSYHELDRAIQAIRRQIRYSKNIKQERISELNQKLPEIMERFKTTLKALNDENEDQSCFIWSEKKLAVLSVVTVLFTGGSIFVAALSGSEVAKWLAVGFGWCAASATGMTTCYTGKMSLDEKKKAELKEISKEGLQNAKWLKKFLKAFEELKTNENKELKQNVKKMQKIEKRMSRLFEKSESEFMKIYGEKLTNQSPSTETQTIPTPFNEKPIPALPLPDDRMESSNWEPYEGASNPNLIASPDVEEIKPESQDLDQSSPKVAFKQEEVDNGKSSDLLDKKITDLLSCYEEIPEKYNKREDYLQLLSLCIQHLPKNDPVKLEFDQLSNRKEDIIEPTSMVEKEEKSSADQEEKGISLELKNVSKIENITETVISQRYFDLTQTVASRFKIRRSIDHLNAPNGFRVTSKGTVRIKKDKINTAPPLDGLNLPEETVIDINEITPVTKKRERKRSESAV